MPKNIDERAANGEITAESAVHRKEQVLKDIEWCKDHIDLFTVLKSLSVINRDNGKKFTCTDRLDTISSILWNSKYRRINSDGLFNLYSAKPPEQLSGMDLILVSSHVDCQQNITKCFSSCIDENTLCGTYDNSITNASILYLMSNGALPDNVLVAFTGDEEKKSKGAKHLNKYLNSKNLNIKTIVVLDVTDMGWDEKADFTVENNFWSESTGKSVIDIADRTNYNWRFVPENIDEIPKYVASEKVVYEEAEADESWFYYKKEKNCFSFCLPVDGEMHSDRGVLVLKKSFINYTESLAILLNGLKFGRL